MPRTKEQFQEIREESKKRILKAALVLFSKNGYSKTSISEIAKHAGVSKGLAYNYFTGKEHIMEEVIKILLNEIDEMFFVLESIKNPFEKIEKIIDMTFEMLKEKKDFWRLYTTLLLQSEVKEIANKIAGNFLEQAFSELEKIFRKAKIKNPASEARIFGAILDGVSFHILFQDSAYPVARIKKLLKQKYSYKE